MLNTDVYNVVLSLLQTNQVAITNDTPLIGNSGIFDSMKLIELCLALEDRAVDIGFDFDWTSAAAMSQSRSMFKTIGTLSFEFNRQKTEQM